MLPYRSFPPKSGNAANSPTKVPVTSLEKIAKEITARGNDMEVRSSKDGIKVLEVSKKVVAVFPFEK